MADVIVDQRFLGIVDCVLDRLELLSKLNTRSALRHHADDLPKVPFGAPEPFDDLGMSLVLHVPLPFRREDSAYPPRGIGDYA